MNMIRWMWWMLAAGMVLPAGAETGHRTPPVSLMMTAPSVTVEDGVYSFEVTMSEYKIVRGVPQLRVSVTVAKVTETGNARFRDIVQIVTHDRSSLTIAVDGRTFVLEANYRDPFDRNMEPRLIPTTFGEMFQGGKVGLTVRLAT